MCNFAQAPGLVEDEPGSPHKRAKAPAEPVKKDRGVRQGRRPDGAGGETLDEADLEEQAGVLSELEWWRSEEREEEPAEPAAPYYEQHLGRPAGSERKSRVPPVGNGKVVTKIRIGADVDGAETAGRNADKQWGQIKLSPTVADSGHASPSFADHDPDSELAPLRPREMSLDWQPGIIPVAPAEVDTGDSSVSEAGDDVVGDEMMHSPLQTMQDAALPEPSATVSGGDLDDWW